MVLRATPYAVLIVIAAVSGCDRSPRITAPSPIPAAPQAVLEISPSPEAPLGAAGYTPFIFDASASTGDRLRYQIEFGDGEVSGAAVAQHVAPTDGRRTARLTVTDRRGRISQVEHDYFAAAIETRSLTFWHVGLGGRRDISITLRQDGANLSGLMQMKADALRNVPLIGRLSGDRDVVIRSADGAIEMAGSLEWRTPDDINYSQARVVLRLTIRGGPADGESVRMTWADPY